MKLITYVQMIILNNLVVTNIFTVLNRKGEKYGCPCCIWKLVNEITLDRLFMLFNQLIV